MRYASVCDGIGAVHAAWQPLGWQCMWTSEIDSFPSAVVEQRWGFENRGDMTKHKEWTTDEGSSIDLLVGGTPCQSFSVAGLRQGLKDPRGNLMLTYLAIAERLKPRWIVWENVPGVLSSNGGKDFGSFLGALGDLGYGWAYRVLDAQWFGVAQRRRRVFVVGCFGDAASAAKVLFESESVQRNPAPSRTSREKTSGPIAGCSNGGGANGPGRTADDADSLVVAHVPVMVMAHGQANAEICEGYSPTLSCAHEVPIAFAQPQAFYSTESRCENIPKPGLSPALKVGSNGGGQPPAVAFATDLYNGAIDGDVSHSIRVGNGNAMGGVPSALVDVFCDSINGSRRMQGVMPAVTHTLKGRGFDGSEDGTGRGTPIVIDRAAFNQGQNAQYEPHIEETDVMDALVARGPRAVGQPAALAMAVRRLTPRECERLQGFPDDYTAIEYRKKPAADGPRYKALGNSMAVPCMRWIGERIEAADRECVPK